MGSLHVKNCLQLIKGAKRGEKGESVLGLGDEGSWNGHTNLKE